MNELKNRGVEDVLIAVVDGLRGFPGAIKAAFPQAVVQTCVVHLIRHSLEFVSWKDQQPIQLRTPGPYFRLRLKLPLRARPERVERLGRS